MNVIKARDLLSYSWWLVPSLVALSLAALAVGMVVVDTALPTPPPWLTFSGSASDARQLLSAINSSVLTFTALAFSVTVLVLTLISAQLSPRVLRVFLHDRPSQLSLGVFVGTYLYSLVVLQQIRGTGTAGEAFIPHITIALLFLLIAGSVVLFVYFVHHIIESIRVSTLASRIAHETRATIVRLYPPPGAPAEPNAEDGATVLARLRACRTVNTTQAGFVNAVESARLVAAATSAGCVLELLPRVGDFVRTGAPLVRIHADGELHADAADRVDQRLVRRVVSIQQEGSLRQDVTFGIRQLVDIAEHAQSPGVNDPTTSIECLHLIHDLLWHIAIRPPPPVVHRDEYGAIRLVLHQWSWEDLVHLAMDELRHWGADSLQMHRQLRGVITDLLDVVGDDRQRRAPLEEQWRLLEARLESDLPEAERGLARRKL